MKTFDSGLYDVCIRYLKHSFYHSRSSGLLMNSNLTKNHFQWLRSQKSIIIIFFGVLADRMAPQGVVLGLGHYARAFTLVAKWGNSPEWQLCNICHPRDRTCNWMFTLFRPLRTLFVTKSTYMSRHWMTYTIYAFTYIGCMQLWLIMCIHDYGIYKFTFQYSWCYHNFVDWLTIIFSLIFVHWVY